MNKFFKCRFGGWEMFNVLAKSPAEAALYAADKWNIPFEDARFIEVTEC